MLINKIQLHLKTLEYFDFKSIAICTTVIHRVFQKTALSLEQHNFAIVSHTVTRFSLKYSEINWKHKKDILCLAADK